MSVQKKKKLPFKPTGKLVEVHGKQGKKDSIYVPGSPIRTSTPYEGPIATKTNVKPGGRTIEEILAPRMKEKRGPGRPQREYDINWDQVYQMILLHCSGPEISQVLNVPYSTLAAMPEFQALYKKGWEEGKAGLRRKQWECMERQILDGKSTMCIFLGKNWLGQRDVVSVDSLNPETSLPKGKAESNLENLTTQELETMRKLLEKAQQGPVN